MTLTLSSPDEFTTLFIVIIFHRTSLAADGGATDRAEMFEGLGLGTRLAFLQLSPSWSWAPLFGAVVYAIITPLGMAIGLGTRQTVSMSSATASITSGVLDAISSGILLYA
jgi:zinc transporter 1/2/3